MLLLGALGAAEAAGDEQEDFTPVPPVDADLPVGASRLGLYEVDLGSADPREELPKGGRPLNALP